MTDIPGTILRPAVPSDAARIAALFTDEGYPVAPSTISARLARFSDEASRVIVADNDGTVIGFVACHAIPRFEHDDMAVRILALVVDPGARERGVGRRLVAEVERLADGLGAAFVEVTAGHHRPDARRLYESMGYDSALTAYLRKRL
jgi:GNAT superfamily N-acetyltransferase